MKGIVLAAGGGTRLYPATKVVNKQLLPVYDKPMIFYPLATLIQAGIRDILLITTPEDLPLFQKLLKDGGWGVSLSFAVQQRPGGIAEALLLGEEFVGNSSFALILGDNLFYGPGLSALLRQAWPESGRAAVFAYEVEQPQHFGVVELDNQGRALSLEEKPAHPKSPYAVTGLYFYDKQAMIWAKKLRPSNRGELEITDLNRLYLQAGLLDVVFLPEYYFWLDLGSAEHLLLAANFVQQIQERLKMQIALPGPAVFG